MSIGLDLGTSYIISARKKDEETVFQSCRDAFFTVSKNPYMVKLLKQQKVNFITQGNEIHIVGDDAIKTARAFDKTTRRPMQRGVLSPKERAAVPMLKELVKSVLGKPQYKNEICTFSIPAPPVDAGYDIIYHENVARSMLSGLGFKPMSINEAQALAYSELGDEMMTGAAISFGAGMVNACIVIYGELVTAFSLGKSGDWIDTSIGTSLGMNITSVQHNKENFDIDIGSPTDTFSNAVSIYYSHLINEVVNTLASYILENNIDQKFSDPLKVVIGGGTSLIKGFIPKLQQTIDNHDSFNLNIKELVHAKEPLYAVANGCLIHSELNTD